jgi:hypothetical protein
VSGRAEDDTAMGRVEVAIVNAAGQYMSSSGGFTSTSESWRSAFLNSPGTPGSNFSSTTPVIPPGAYTVRVRAVDGRASTDENAPTLTYAWSFGNGRSGTGSVPSHTYTTAGTFTVTLTVTDGWGRANSTTRSITVT